MSPQARLLSRQSLDRTSSRRLGRLHARRCGCGSKRREATGVSNRPTATSGGRSTSLPSSTTCGASTTQLVCRPARRTRQSISRTPPWSESKQQGSNYEQTAGIQALVDRSRASLLALHDRELKDVESARGRYHEQMRGAEDAVEEAHRRMSHA